MFSNNYYDISRIEFVLEYYDFFILGIITSIFILVTLIVSGKMIYRGIIKHNKLIIYTGIAAFGVGGCWFGAGLNFLCIILFNIIPPWEIYFILHGGIVPFTLTFWIVATTELLMYKEKNREIIKVISAILAIIVLIIYIYIVFTNRDLIGTPISPIQARFGPFSFIYLSGLLVIFLFFGGNFVKESLTAKDSKIKLKGKYLAIFLIMFTISSILEVFFQETWLLAIARITIMVSSIFFYFGFLK
ncbi:MAG: hypothetical protein EU541_02820 [Promethearchaeota archaeon]|nr:MAG: hypothetical protein EU541_02820 [Candidatus Lokiarchaeota archaeon]